MILAWFLKKQKIWCTVWDQRPLLAQKIKWRKSSVLKKRSANRNSRKNNRSNLCKCSRSLRRINYSKSWNYLANNLFSIKSRLKSAKRLNCRQHSSNLLMKSRPASPSSKRKERKFRNVRFSSAMSKSNRRNRCASQWVTWKTKWRKKRHRPKWKLSRQGLLRNRSVRSKSNWSSCRKSKSLDAKLCSSNFISKPLKPKRGSNLQLFKLKAATSLSAKLRRMRISFHSPHFNPRRPTRIQSGQMSLKRKIMVSH